MVIDTSALVAVLLAEPERDAFVELVSGAGVKLVSAVNAFEAAIVIHARKGPAGARELDLLFHAGGMEIVPFDDGQLTLAREAYERYGKGRHPAALNLGDCCAYALARSSAEPLLFKGTDFSQTDVQPAVTS